MIETRFSTTSRSTPATSTPCLKAPSTAARMPKRNSATANDPAVSAVRVFLRSRLLTTRCRYFTVEPRRDGSRACVRAVSPPVAGRHGFHEPALLQPEVSARARGGQRAAARRGHVEAAEQVEQRRLAGAARPHERDEIAGVDVEVEPLEHVDLLASPAVGLPEPPRSDQALAVSTPIDADHESPVLSAHCAWLSLHTHGLAVTELFGSGGDDLLAVREAGDDLLLVAAGLAKPHRPPLNLSVAVHEHRRDPALLDQSRARDQDPSRGRGRAPLLAEERDLDAHVGQDAR